VETGAFKQNAPRLAFAQRPSRLLPTLGFSAENTGSLRMPGPYERERLLAHEFVPGTLGDAHGNDRGRSVTIVAARVHVS
jgi:hypothetical protein